MSDRSRRPFWLHQIAEYVIGLALVASGLQSHSPTVPSVLGGIVVINAAVADAPLGAFRVVGRRLHRVLDITVVIVAMIASIVVDIDLATRIVQVCCVIVLAVVAVNTDYAPRTTPPNVGTAAVRATGSEAIGRRAGRVAGSVVARARTRWSTRGESPRVD